MDTSSRELERSDDPDLNGERWRDLLRRGERSEAQARMAANCGDVGARAALDLPEPSPYLAEWLFGLREVSDEALARGFVALYASAPQLGALYVPFASRALSALDAWFAGDRDEQRLRAALDPIRESQLLRHLVLALQACLGEELHPRHIAYEDEINWPGLPLARELLRETYGTAEPPERSLREAVTAKVVEFSAADEPEWRRGPKWLLLVALFCFAPPFACVGYFGGILLHVAGLIERETALWGPAYALLPYLVLFPFGCWFLGERPHRRKLRALRELHRESEQRSPDTLSPLA